MAACCGAAITPESSVIDSQIKSDEKVQKTSLKVLVLGTSASGKSTVAKQMKILHCDGFSPEELHNYKQILILNIFNGMKELVFQAEQFGIKILRKNKKVAAYFSNANPYTETLSSDTVEQAKQLWADKGVQKMWERRNEIDFPTNLEYMMNNIDRFAEENFLPTNTDVLYARQRTTGVVETGFAYRGFSWSLIDVGGQRSERRKWIHFFEGVQAIIFCAALDEFDMVCPEEPSRNKMEESLEVFEKMVNGDWFKTQPFVLFLNKCDLFREKIGQIDLKKAFPSYTGSNTYDDAVEFIKSQYLSRVLQREEEVFVHVTCAIDTENVDFVFKAFSETIFAKRLKYSGLMMTEFQVGQRLFLHDGRDTSNLYSVHVVDARIDARGKPPQFLLHFIATNQQNWVTQESIMTYFAGVDNDTPLPAAPPSSKSSHPAAPEAAPEAASSSSRDRVTDDAEEPKSRKKPGPKQKEKSTSKIIDHDYDSLPVKIPLPPQLRQKLNDDAAMILTNKEILPLPRTPSASDILDHWSRDFASSDVDAMAVIDMLKKLFRKELGKHLLYRLERLQYAELVARNSSVTVDHAYGAEHLLRLFVVLPWFLSNSKLSEELVHSVKIVVTNIMDYMRLNMTTFFATEYESASPAALADADLAA